MTTSKCIVLRFGHARRRRVAREVFKQRVRGLASRAHMWSNDGYFTTNSVALVASCVVLMIAGLGLVFQRVMLFRARQAPPARAVRVTRRSPREHGAMSSSSQSAGPTSAQSARHRDVPARRVASNQRTSNSHVREGSISNSLVQGTRAGRHPFSVDRDSGNPCGRTTAAISVSSRDPDKGRARNSLREGVSSSESFRTGRAGKKMHEVLETLQRLRNELRNRDCSRASAMWGPVYAPRDSPPGGRPLSMSWRAMKERHATYGRLQTGEITSSEVSQHPFLSLAPTAAEQEAGVLPGPVTSAAQHDCPQRIAHA